MKFAALLAAALLAVTACRNADLEERVAKLEKNLAEREEALQFLEIAYQQQAEAQSKPVAGTVYGVDIAANLALGQYEGALAAPVTIVEAWDFA